LENGVFLIELLKDLIIDSYNQLDKFLDNISIYEKYNLIKQILIDLSKVKYMDSSGISLLIKYNKIFPSTNIPLKLFGLSNNVKKIFTLTRINTIFNISDSFEEAVENEPKESNVKKDIEKFEIIVPGDFSYHRLCTDFVIDISKSKFLMQEDEIYDLRLAIEEILTNAIEHGYKEAKLCGNLQVWCMIVDDNLIVGVNDYGQGFDREKILDNIDKVPENPMNERGRGIFIVSQLVDDYIMDSNQNKNSIFYFVKRYKKRDKGYCIWII